MRVALIAETFLPQINGVSNSVLRVLEHLRATGHDALVICADDPKGVPGSYLGFPVETTGSVTLPFYPDFRLSTTNSVVIERILADYQPDVVHLASPFALGYHGMHAAARLGLPTVAIYQTDMPAYVAQYGFPAGEAIVWRYLRRLHNMATTNLAPSTAAQEALIEQGIARVGIWARGVDTARFHPGKRSQALHDQWAPNGERVIGYMGRLGAEKQVDDLAVLADVPNTRLVIIGGGPEQEDLSQQLPQALFTGMLKGEELAVSLASLDLFVHPGEFETFGQAIQEALASGLPVIAPRKGGPIDLVRPSHTGWLYEPGDLKAMHDHVRDLIGDDAKRATFSRAARDSVRERTWPAICAQLVQQYQAAIELGVRLPQG